MLPNTLTAFGNGASRMFVSNMKYTKIPDSVSNIGEVLSYSSGTYTYSKVVDFGNTRTTVPSYNYISNVGSNIKIYVPDAMYDTWIATGSWSSISAQIHRHSELEAPYATSTALSALTAASQASASLSSKADKTKEVELPVDSVGIISAVALLAYPAGSTVASSAATSYAWAEPEVSSSNMGYVFWWYNGYWKYGFWDDVGEEMQFPLDPSTIESLYGSVFEQTEYEQVAGLSTDTTIQFDALGTTVRIPQTETSSYSAVYGGNLSSIVKISQADYDVLSAGGTADANTLYVIV